HQEASPYIAFLCCSLFFQGSVLHLNSNRLLFFIEVAILTALALILDIMPFLKFKIWPMGGSISFAMIPVFILAFRWVLKGGLLSGFFWCSFQIEIVNVYIITFCAL